jgi:hypothetical protein
MPTPAELLATELRRDAARPFITEYGDDGRVELSVATIANWVAKTAGYLIDEIGVEPGDAIAVNPALHWQHAVALLAAWSVGARVDLGPSPEVEPLEVPLDLLGAEFSRLVAGYPDRYDPAEPSGEDAVAAAPKLAATARLLTTVALDATGAPVGLLAPLAAGGSVVYAPATADLAAIAAAERVTHAAGVDLPGLPRIR